MTATIISGRDTSKKVTERHIEMVKALQAKGVTPKLVVITVGDNEESNIYVTQKQKRALKSGMDFDWIKLPEATTAEELEAEIKKNEADPKVSGLIVQFPLPEHLNEDDVTHMLSPDKDVDGFHPENIGLMVQGVGKILPCTPKGIIYLLDEYGIDIAGKDVVVVGRSQLVGMPVSIMLTHCDATVTTCHTKTKDIKAKLQNADIVIVAAGSPKLIKADDLKEGAVVIDGGITYTDEGVFGDVDFDDVQDKVAAISPVPGGVGPMTVAMLMDNTVISAALNNGLDPDEVFKGI